MSIDQSDQVFAEELGEMEEWPGLSAVPCSLSGGPEMTACLGT